MLAYSGGLDTTACIFLLKEKYGFDEVITVTVDVGQPRKDIEKARKLGEKYADKHYTIDAREEYVNLLYQLIKANGEYEGYFLGTAISRPLIAEKVAEIAMAEGTEYVAHGCTGKGNDQLRFDNIFHQYNLKILAPVRELNLTRTWELGYLKSKGVIVTSKEKPYSVDENLWNRSVEGGYLEDPSLEPSEDIYEWTKITRKDPEYIKIDFEKGIPVALNGKRMNGLELINKLNEIGGKHGIGRVDIIEDRVLGFKSRENYENPAATILITAHRDLEKLVLTRKELKFKRIVEEEWAELVYQGLINEPLFEDLNAFIDKTQERVTGWVKLKLYSGLVTPVARDSPYSLYRHELVSFESVELEQKYAEGFSVFHGMQGRIYKRMMLNKS